MKCMKYTEINFFSTMKMYRQQKIMRYFQNAIMDKLIFQLVLCDSVNRNKVSIRHSPFFYFPSLTTCFGSYGTSSGEVYTYMFLRTI
jgi:hypothetical protein